MKPNFEEMTVPELRVYVLSHRDDLEAMRALFHHPSLTYQKAPRMFNDDGTSNEENIRIGEEMLRQHIEKSNEKEKKEQQED